MAGVILAVSFSKNSPVVDSNIARVLNRYFGMALAGEIRRNKKIVEKADELFSHCNCEPKELLFACEKLKEIHIKLPGAATAAAALPYAPPSAPLSVIGKGI